MNDITNTIEKRFTYHPPIGTQPLRFVILRDLAKGFANAIVDNCLDGRERSIALTKLEEVIMWANAGIARESFQIPAFKHVVLSDSDVIKAAAAAAHEVNRVWCEFCGDTSQPAWCDAPEWQKESAINGADAVYKNPDMTPEQQHDCWMSEKKRDGWVYGPEKNVEKKEHPCMVPYDELPAEQRVKDAFFGAVVRSVLALTQVGPVTAGVSYAPLGGFDSRTCYQN